MVIERERAYFGYGVWQSVGDALSDYKRLSSTLSSGFNSSWGANFLKFNGVVFLVVDDVFIDSEMVVVISSISKICRLNL